MIGYCCISLGPNVGKSKKDHLTVNRGMIKKTFESKGLGYVSDLSILNLRDCKKILEWNIRNDIYVYRLSSDMFPCLGFYRLEDLPKFDLIKRILEDIGKYVMENNIRVTFHPSHFCVLASDKSLVVSNAVDELNKHSQIFDLMGIPMTPYHAINIHIGTTKPTLEDAANRFVNNFQLLSDSCKKRLTIENDDSPNQYSVLKLYKMVYEKIGIPIVVDSLHYTCNKDNMSWEDTLKLGISTWNNIKPLVHHSSSKKLYEDKSSKLEAHSDFLYEKFIDFGIDLDIELECKQKDIALIKYRKDFP